MRKQKRNNNLKKLSRLPLEKYHVVEISKELRRENIYKNYLDYKLSKIISSNFSSPKSNRLASEREIKCSNFSNNFK